MIISPAPLPVPAPAPHAARRKAVWGPKLTSALIAAAFLLAGLAPNAMAAGQPKGAAPKGTPASDVPKATSTPTSQQPRRVELRVSTDLPTGVAGSPYAGSLGVARGN